MYQQISMHDSQCEKKGIHLQPTTLSQHCGFNIMQIVFFVLQTISKLL